MVNRTSTEDTRTSLSTQLSTQLYYQLWTTSSEMIQKVILQKTTSDTGESTLFLSIKHTIKHCNNSLYRVWWYLSYGAENKLFYFIFILFISGVLLTLPDLQYYLPRWILQVMWWFPVRWLGLLVGYVVLPLAILDIWTRVMLLQRHLDWQQSTSAAPSFEPSTS